MKLSKRLQKIADMIKTPYVIDVGCDHALLDIYLAHFKKINCLACDISENALTSAKMNIKRYQVESFVSTLCTDGLEQVEIPKDATIVIAGMGAMTAFTIIEKRLEEINHIIVSVHSDIELFRRKMVSYGFYIKEEAAVFEKNQYYVIFAFEKGIREYETIDYELGPFLKHDKDYVSYCIKKQKRILSSLPDSYVEKKEGIMKKIEAYQKW
ncbi:MAG: SAM-dependent methyltransferase [Firmicutes bacterium]|nr:SAM-dependent methyltransferase [Bacillota bacterium]